MKPQPMSEAEIDAVREEFISWDGDFFRCESPELAGFVAAIIAARDAQWAAMIGEPVAWDVQQGSRTFLVRAAEFNRLSFDAGSFSPLYAIKETP